jgi:8-oxo-dGTP pyrophosphatase MutT (NUDIX family)
MWVGRRSADRRLYPGRLDNLVAGGLPHGVSLVENLRKECAEEAGMTAALADQATEVGSVIYCRDSERGLKPDVMFCYDLEVPEDFEPRCTDGEVETFYRLPLEEVYEVVRETEEFKLNCNLVIIDFLVRHGLIPREDPQYEAIARGLRSPLPSSDPHPTPIN